MVRYVERHVLQDGKIHLYIDGDKKTPNWYGRFKIPDSAGYYIKSSGTTILDEAIKWAERTYIEAQMKVVHQIPLRSHTFRREWAEWITHVEANLSIHRQKLHRGTGARYFIPFFGDTDVTQIKEKKIDEYWQWRIAYWGTQAFKPSNAKFVPAKKSLTMEKSLLSQFFKFEKRRSIIVALPIIDLPEIKKDAIKEMDRRPDFSQDEMDILIPFMERWANQGYTSFHTYYRKIMVCVCLMAYYTGMRPNEMAQLRWCDVSLPEDNVMAFDVAPTTKTGQRTQVGMPDVFSLLIEVQKITKADTTKDGLIFCDSEGKAIEWGHKTFKEMLTEAGMLKDTYGRDRTLYSFRHTYATQRLLAGVPIDQLANNLGTSVQYIMKHYNHTTNVMNAKSLTRGTTESSFFEKFDRLMDELVTPDFEQPAPTDEASLINSAWD